MVIAIGLIASIVGLILGPSGFGISVHRSNETTVWEEKIFESVAYTQKLAQEILTNTQELNASLNTLSNTVTYLALQQDNTTLQTLYSQLEEDVIGVTSLFTSTFYNRCYALNHNFDFQESADIAQCLDDSLARQYIEDNVLSCVNGGLEGNCQHTALQSLTKLSGAFAGGAKKKYNVGDLANYLTANYNLAGSAGLLTLSGYSSVWDNGPYLMSNATAVAAASEVVYASAIYEQYWQLGMYISVKYPNDKWVRLNKDNFFGSFFPEADESQIYAYYLNNHESEGVNYYKLVTTLHNDLLQAGLMPENVKNHPDPNCRVMDIDKINTSTKPLSSFRYICANEYPYSTKEELLAANAYYVSMPIQYGTLVMLPGFRLNKGESVQVLDPSNNDFQIALMITPENYLLVTCNKVDSHCYNKILSGPPAAPFTNMNTMATMRDNGYFAFYGLDDSDFPWYGIWHSDDREGPDDKDAFLALQTNGELLMYTKDSVPNANKTGVIWSANTWY